MRRPAGSTCTPSAARWPSRSGCSATAWALFRLRHRKDLLLGAIVLVVLLVLEAYLGGLIRDDGKDSLTAVHIPLAMFLMAVSVWLPLRAARGTSAR